MRNKLFFKITVPIVILMLGLGTILYFFVLRTVNEFAQQNIELDLEDISHELFNIVDYQFMQSIKTGRADDEVALKISQVDCLDMLERKALANQFKLLVFEEPNHTFRMASSLPGDIDPQTLVESHHIANSGKSIRIGNDDFFIREFFFSPWKWNVLILKNTGTYAELSMKVHQVYFISVMVLFFTTAIFVYYLLYNIKTPISSIISSLKKEESPDYKGTYEFEYLSETIAEMRSSLQKEVSERKRAEQRAEAASKAKSEFLANMSHELRTPLNAILGFAQIMERSKRDSSDEVALRIIRRSGNHLLTLINQILDLSKIEAGQIIISEQSFDLLSLLDELKSMLMLKASKKGISLHFDISEEVPRYIYTDEIKLRQVLINLLSNAIKFTDEGHVALRISCRNNIEKPTLKDSAPTQLLAFEIEDTGIGIDKKDKEQVFQAFTQAATVQSEEEGTGLGLVISKKFVELLGGRIALESTPGVGSIFFFSIPVKVMDHEQISHGQQGSRVVGLNPDQQSYRILVADDKRDNRQLLVRLLEPIGFTIREAANGQEAIRLFEDWEPHLIIMDIRMPVLDGIEATKIIRQTANPAKQPSIIAVTASVLQTKLESFSEDGCNDVLIKPFHENELLALLKKHLKLEYVYDNDPKAVKLNEIDTTVTSSADLYDLPQETIDQLKKSINALKMDEALGIIDIIKEQNEPLALRLQKLVLAYRFDTLQDMLEQSGVK